MRTVGRERRRLEEEEGMKREKRKTRGAGVRSAEEKQEEMTENAVGGRPRRRVGVCTSGRPLRCQFSGH